MFSSKEATMASSEENNETDCSTYSFEDILEKAGSLGRWQIVMSILIAGSQIFSAMHLVSAVFVSATPDFTCQIPELITFPHDQQFVLDRLSIQYTSECSRNLHNYTALTSEVSTQISANDVQDLLSNEMKPCNEWNFDTSIYSSTVVSEWDLVCSRKWLKTIVQATFMIGILIGSTVYGQLSDKYGRRTMILFCTVCLVVSSMVTSFSQDYGTFLALRFFVALNCAGIMVIQFVLIMEIIKAESRTVFGMLDGVPFGAGIALVAIFAYFFRDWRTLHFALGSSSAFMLFYFFVLPESPRWLLSENKPSDALKVLKTIAKFNKKSLPDDKEMMELLNKCYNKTDSKDAKTSRWNFNCLVEQWTLVRTPIMRRRCLISFFVWFSAAMIYYGLIFSGANLNVNPFLMIFVSGTVEIPAFILTIFILLRFGRRITSCSLFFLSGLVLMVLLAVPRDYKMTMFTLSTAGKFLATAVFQLAYLYTSELVPTHVRNIAVGTSSMFGRVGSSIAPFVLDFLSDLHYMAPTFVFAVLAILAGISSLFLPETMNKPLPQTVAEVENKKC